ncbi:hypothetical protein N7455_010294 [Penicillium solitum]|uniref:uncharacterized protein n=1 Tax=Penicillium solitum TaxID=60172 RepID=UPI0032C3FC6C|nr:hypothetical protein N7455_010294 [Penicillium solitum]
MQVSCACLLDGGIGNAKGQAGVGACSCWEVSLGLRVHVSKSGEARHRRTLSNYLRRLVWGRGVVRLGCIEPPFHVLSAQEPHLNMQCLVSVVFRAGKRLGVDSSWQVSPSQLLMWEFLVKTNKRQQSW